MQPFNFRCDPSQPKWNSFCKQQTVSVLQKKCQEFWVLKTHLNVLKKSESPELHDVFKFLSYLTWILRLAAFLNSFVNQNSFKRHSFYESLNFLHGSDAEVIVNVFVFSHLLLRCRNNSDEHLVVRRRCCHYVACIAIALPWCTYCHIDHTGMLHPPPTTFQAPLVSYPSI